MNVYFHDINNLNKTWSREAIIGKDLKTWMENQLCNVNNSDKYGNKFVNQDPRLMKAVKDLQEYELECHQRQYYIGFDHIKQLLNEYIHDVNHLKKTWSREAIIGENLQKWMNILISYINNPDKNGDKFVNKYPELIEAVKELEAYELECQKQQVLIRIDHIKKLFNEYIHDVNHLN